MDNRKKESYRTIFNVKLSKITGLYQILDSESVKLKNHNVYKVVNVILVLFLFLVSIMLLVNGVNLWTKHPIHRSDTVLNTVIAESFVFTSYKVCVIMYRSHDIQDCFPITRFDFTSIGCRHTPLLELWRSRCIKFTNFYAYISYLSAIVCVMFPLWLGDKFSTITAADGSVSYYRTNVLNIYTLFSAETYNANFFTMYLVEMGAPMIFIYFLIISDTLLAELCLSLVCHLKIINTTLELLGHELITYHEISSKWSNSIKTTLTKLITTNCY